MSEEAFDCIQQLQTRNILAFIAKSTFYLENLFYRLFSDLGTNIVEEILVFYFDEQIEKR